MAELKNIVMSVVALLFVASAIVTVYSYAIVNNATNGGSGSSIPFPLMNQTVAYTAQMTQFSQQLSNSTESASTQPSASNAFTGIGALSQAGTAAISLSFSSLSILITMIASVGTSLIPIGIPPIVFAFGVLSITIGLVFAILAAVFKWWI